MRGYIKEFPKEIEIKDGIFYKIKFKRTLQNSKYDGICFFHDKEIWISTGLTRRERLETFWHEVQHALDYEWELKIPHKMIYNLEKPMSFLFSRNTWIQWADWKDCIKEN